MIALIIFLTGIFIALGTGVLASISDFKGMKIPNLYSAIVALSFVVVYGVLWLLDVSDVTFFAMGSHLIAALVVFAVTAVMFFAKAIGAADSKLATAYALWLGVKGMIVFLFYMALAGGILAIIALILKKMRPIKNPAEGSWIARVQAGESKVPYGIAIFIGALASFAELGYLNIETFVSFISP